MHDLQSLYSTAAGTLATSLDWKDDDDPALCRSIIRRGDLPAPGAELATADVFVRRGAHLYPSLRVDAVHFFATPDAYRCLGLWIVACLLEPGARQFQLRLTHPGSEVRRICIDTGYRSLDAEREGLQTEPHAVIYYPGQLAAFPLADRPPPLPSLRLTDLEGYAGMDDEEERDTLSGLGSDAGAWLFAELLLNLGQSWNPRVEVNLEGPFGFGGAAPDSAEVRFWLPGSVGWAARAATG